METLKCSRPRERDRNLEGRWGMKLQVWRPGISPPASVSIPVLRGSGLWRQMPVAQPCWLYGQMQWLHRLHYGGAVSWHNTFKLKGRLGIVRHAFLWDFALRNSKILLFRLMTCVTSTFSFPFCVCSRGWHPQHRTRLRQSQKFSMEPDKIMWDQRQNYHHQNHQNWIMKSVGDPTISKIILPLPADIGGIFLLGLLVYSCAIVIFVNIRWIFLWFYKVLWVLNNSLLLRKRMSQKYFVQFGVMIRLRSSVNYVMNYLTKF